MNRTSLIAVLVVGIAACTTDGKKNDEPVIPEEIACAITSPAAADLLHDTVSVVVAIDGPATLVELLVGGAVVTGLTIAEQDVSASLDWDTTGTGDGAATIVARCSNAVDETEDLSDGVEVLLDNTAPTAAFGEGFPRISVVEGEVVVDLSIVEDNVASIVVTDGETEIFTASEMASSFTWDTTAAQDGLHELGILVTDAVGRTAQVTGHPAIVINNGEQRTVGYVPGDAVYIPTNYLDVEYHVRAQTGSWPGVREFISWVVWDASLGWNIDYDIGQGICPHEGITYMNKASTGGEIIIALNRQDLLPPIVARLPVEDQTSDVFPHNSDPLTFGLYFGHVNPLDAADHVEEVLPIEVGMVFLY